MSRQRDQRLKLSASRRAAATELLMTVSQLRNIANNLPSMLVGSMTGAEALRAMYSAVGSDAIRTAFELATEVLFARLAGVIDEPGRYELFTDDVLLPMLPRARRANQAITALFKLGEKTQCTKKN